MRTQARESYECCSSSSGYLHKNSTEHSSIRDGKRSIRRVCMYGVRTIPERYCEHCCSTQRTHFAEGRVSECCMNVCMRMRMHRTRAACLRQQATAARSMKAGALAVPPERRDRVRRNASSQRHPTAANRSDREGNTEQ